MKTTAFIPRERNMTERLSSHLSPLCDDNWALWRWVCLRGAGFPADIVLKLATPEFALMADRALDAEEQVKGSRQSAITALAAMLDENVRQQGEQIAPDRDTQRLLRRVRKGKIPTLEDELSYGPEIKALREAYHHAASAKELLRGCFKAAAVSTAVAVQEVASDPRFCEAIIWQNRHAFSTAISPLLKMAPGSSCQSSRSRDQEKLVANYLQRYCTKNDTIGFFGPVGWAKIVSCDEVIKVRPGRNMIATRRAYFEVWCIDALAQALLKDERLRAWIAPRRKSYIYLEGTRLHVPFKAPTKLAEQQAAILKACDGERTAREIAQEIVMNPSFRVKTEQEVYDILEIMKEISLLNWSLEMPLDLYPETYLRRALERVNESDLRDRALGALDGLEAAREGVAMAAGDPVILNEALENLERTFTQLTGIACTRAEGKTYGARTLLFEDCRRDLELEIGPSLIESFAKPLSLLLTSARWITFQAAATLREKLQQVYAEMVCKSGCPTVALSDFLEKVEPLLSSADYTDKLMSDFQKKWSDVLGLPQGERRAHYSSQDLLPRVKDAFDAPRSGWGLGRYHSPDLMIAASSVEAIQRGDFEVVMGELHIALNTLSYSLFLAQHPSPHELYANYEADLPEPSIVVQKPKDLGCGTGRGAGSALLSSKDYYIEAFDQPSSINPSQVIPIGNLVVEDRGSGLIVRTRSTGLHFDIIEVLANLLSVFSVGSFKMFQASSHTPRINIDRLVVQRESWAMPVSAIKFAYEGRAGERFLEARRWGRAHKMPRFVFVVSPVEVKPFFLDFDSLIYVDIFARIIRRTATLHGPDALIQVSEMLPSIDQAWLPDAENQSYTSELRIVAFDLID
ncbi:MAG TPA: lantibiotic dehydratase [Blastocatellia bacterium]|nr:lantibiotic dehydratase [Blastocatellia bacterium]